MTREEAKEFAKEMTYRDAVCNALQGKCIPYRKATLIKLYELLNMIEQQEPITVETINQYCKEHNYILCEKGTEHGKMLTCPNCGLDVHSDFKYCPRCGADMRGEK